jgi:4-amino-4-deoxy-L-arabinose transferase-like glycosyltransferase
MGQMRPPSQFSYLSFVQRPRLQFFLLSTLSSVLLFANLHRGDLAGYDDAVYAQQGRQVLLSGDWWHVRFNGYPDFDKPPLFVWLEAASMWVFGFTDFAAKFPSAMLGVATIMLVYLVTEQLTLDSWLAFLAMFTMATTQYFLKYASHAMTDVPFTFFVTLALWFYLKSLKQLFYLMPCGLAIGLAILTRSILGLIPAGILIAHLLSIGRANVLHSRHFWLGAIGAAFLPMTWFCIQYRSYGDEFIVSHLSFTAENLTFIDPSRGWAPLLGLFHYPWLLLRLYWPWLPLMVIGLISASRGSWKGLDGSALFLIIWIICAVLPFTLISNKVLRYILPAFPAFSILAAIPLSQWISRHRALALRACYGTLCLVILITTGWPGHRLRAQDMKALARAVELNAAPDERVLLYAGGNPHMNFVTQLIWYSNRYCDLLRHRRSVIAALQGRTTPIVVMDRRSFVETFPGVDREIEVLGESENFLCLRRRSKLEAAANSPKRPNRVSQLAD